MNMRYRGGDVKTGPGGFARIQGKWLALRNTPAGKIVESLGWGDCFLGFWDDLKPKFSQAEKENLLETLN